MTTRIPITEEIRQKLKDERDRTGINPSYLLRQTNSEIPDGLTFILPGNWLSGASKTLNTEHLDFILAEYAKLLSNRVEYIPITIELAGHLRAERERTGYMIPDLLRRFDHSCPATLEHWIINSWMNLQSKHGRKDQIEWVLARYAELPDAGA